MGLCIPGILVIVAPKAMVKPRAPLVECESQVVSINDDLAVFEPHLFYSCNQVDHIDSFVKYTLVRS